MEHEPNPRCPTFGVRGGAEESLTAELAEANKRVEELGNQLENINALLGEDVPIVGVTTTSARQENRSTPENRSFEITGHPTQPRSRT